MGFTRFEPASNHHGFLPSILIPSCRDLKSFLVFPSTESVLRHIYLAVTVKLVFIAYNNNTIMMYNVELVICYMLADYESVMKNMSIIRMPKRNHDYFNFRSQRKHCVINERKNLYFFLSIAI